MNASFLKPAARAGFCCLLFCTGFVFAQNEAGQRDTLKYGTDNEITELIKQLKKEKADYLDDELGALMRSTKNNVIKSQVIGFFAEREKKGLEEDAVHIIENRDDVETSNVLAAIDYVGKIKYAGAQESLRAVLEADETQFKAATIRALGSATNNSNAAGTVEYLINYYETKNPSEDLQREVIAALGETRSNKATAFLVDIINEGDRPFLSMAALASLAQIADKTSRETVINAVSSKDPHVRSSAIDALAAFDGAEVDAALIDGFRDSYYKTRIAAAKASGIRQLKEAIPYLKFRAEKDEVPAVRDEAVRSLGAIGDSACAGILEKFFDDKKMSDRVRALAAEMLITINADAYTEKIVMQLDEAKRLGQKQYYNGLATALSKAKTSRAKPFVQRLFASKEANDKALALELTALNGFSNFSAEVQVLANEKSSGLATRAQTVLDKLR